MRTGGRRPLVLCLCWLGPPCSALLAPPPSTPLPAAAVAGRGGRAPFLYSSREPAEVELSERAKQIAQDASERVAARVNYNTVSEQWIGSSWDRRATRAKDVVPTGGPKPKYNPEELQAIREKQAKTFEEIKYRLVLDHVFAVLLLSSVVWGVAGLKETISYVFGGAFGTMYLLLLSRFVQNLGAGEQEGGGNSGGTARLAVVVALVLICGKNRETFNVIYATAGFLTYQIASLAQGLYNDE